MNQFKVIIVEDVLLELKGTLGILKSDILPGSDKTVLRTRHGFRYLLAEILFEFQVTVSDDADKPVSDSDRYA